MCGIAGLLSTTSALEAKLIAQMTSSLRHRGPDDEGYLAVDTSAPTLPVYSLIGPDSAIHAGASIQDYGRQFSLYLGHRRLSILDLSSLGHQPMSYGDDLWIIFNGEIYNYVELRNELKSQGFEFKTGTDTEVILAAYVHWGENCVRHFNGDWAFCIFDRKTQRLFLSRDRYGIKPLYFFQKNGVFAFASEIKSLLTLPFIEGKLNLAKAFEYYVLRCRDHTEQTLFEDIFQLAPGLNCVIDIQTGKTSLTRYYSVQFSPNVGRYDHKKALSYADDVRDLLFDAIRLRLRADVPIGTCLSGGLDSSAIVAIAAKLLGIKHSGSALHTFTASFPGKREDERSFAELVVKHSNLTPHYVFPSAQGYKKTITSLLHHQDEPFGSPAVYSQWEVLRKASQKVKVVLDGQGGDEIFGGYLHNKASFFANLLMTGKVTDFASELWFTMLHSGSISQILQTFKPLPFFLLNSKFKNHLYSRLYGKQFAEFRADFGRTPESGLEYIEKLFNHRSNELLWTYMTSSSLPHLLKAEDRNSMAFSIEARVPFTDYRLVDYVFGLPVTYKFHHGWTKWLLRLAVKDLLPPAVTWRKDKLGFATPTWLTREEEWHIWLGQRFNGRGGGLA